MIVMWAHNMRIPLKTESELYVCSSPFPSSSAIFGSVDYPNGFQATVWPRCGGRDVLVDISISGVVRHNSHLAIAIVTFAASTRTHTSLRG